MKGKYIYILVSAVLLLSSCEKWLSVSSNTQIKGDDLLKSEVGYQEALTGIYLNLALQDLYGKNLTWYFTELIAQPYDVKNLKSDELAIAEHRYTNIIYTKKYIDNIWAKAYHTISSINNLLKFVEANKTGTLSKEVQSLMRGELLGLRAYLHLDLIRLYGHGDLNNRDFYDTRNTIPYVKIYSKDQTPQLTYNETMKLLVRDLRQSMEALTNDPVRGGSVAEIVMSNPYWKNRKVHMNYFAVMGTLARAQMWIGSDESVKSAYDIADSLVKDDIAYDWIAQSKLSSVDNPDRVFSDEHLFSLNTFGLAKNINSYMTDLTYQESATVFVYKEGRIVYDIFNSHSYDWDTGAYLPGYIGYDDYRYANHVRSTSYQGEKYYMGYKLYQNTKQSYPNYNDKIPLVKISEMYYIIAEYYLRNGREDDALGVINFVREKRGLTRPITREIIEEEYYLTIEDELTKEYLRDFISEGQVFYYYKRKGFTNPMSIYDKEFSDTEYLLPYPADEVSIGKRVQ